MITKKLLIKHIKLANFTILKYCSDPFDDVFLTSILKAIKEHESSYKFLLDDFLSDYEKEQMRFLIATTFEYYY